jgi:hypothetical protein
VVSQRGIRSATASPSLGRRWLKPLHEMIAELRDISVA